MASQIYRLYNEPGQFVLNVVDLFKQYKQLVFGSGSRIEQSNMVFCRFQFHTTIGDVSLTPHCNIKQDNISLIIRMVVESNSDLPEGITLHSFRRGGAHYRCFDSDFKFTFRELMACCRWTDTTTMCHYLVSRKISDEINPTMLLNPDRFSVPSVLVSNNAPSNLNSTFDYSTLVDIMISKMKEQGLVISGELQV